MSVKTKLWILTGCVLGGFCLAFGIVFRENRLAERIRALERLAVRAEIETLQMRRQEKNYLLRRSPDYLTAVREHRQAAGDALDRLRSLDPHPDPLCDRVSELLNAYMAGFESMVASSDPQDPDSQTGVFLARSQALHGLAEADSALGPPLEKLRVWELRWLVQGTPASLKDLLDAAQDLTLAVSRSRIAWSGERAVAAYVSALRAYAGKLDDTSSYNAAFAATARELEPVIDTVRRHYEARRRDIARTSTLAVVGVQAGVAVLVLLVCLAVSRGISGPLSRLRRHAGRVARGESTDLDPSVFSGEFRELAWDIARMEKHLVATILDLARKESEAAEEARMAREARRRAEDLARVKSNFLNLVSHELKTPLTSMVGFSQVMLKRLERGLFAELAANRPELSTEFTRFHDNLDIMLAEGHRLAELIDNVLELAALESGHAPLVMNAVSLDDLVDRAVAPFLENIEEKGLSFVRDIPADLPPLRCDRDRMVYVLRHLLSNAVKFTDVGRIACRARREGDMAVITVEDTGRGIPPAMREAVFEKFLQLGDHDTGKVPGLGIGLAASRAVVEYHGGTIHISGAPGRGSTVTVTVPLAEVAPDGFFA